MDGVLWLLLAAMISAGHCFPEKMSDSNTKWKRNAISSLEDLGRDGRKGNFSVNIMKLYLSITIILRYEI